MHEQSLLMRMPFVGLAVASTLISATALNAQSQTAQSQDSTQRAQTLDQMVVTATRSSTAARDIPQKVDVITRKDIEQTPAIDVTGMLKRLSTLDVVEYPSLLSGISIRGFRPETGGLNRRTQILIDGRPAGSGNLALMSLDNIERIEVVKGATSALYGASAMGGTINIITRKSRGPLRANASVLYGSFQTTNVNGHIGGSLSSRFDFDLSGHHYRLGDDYKIGKGNWLRGPLGSRSAGKVVGDSLVKVQDMGDGQVRTASKYDYHNGAARIGYNIGGGMRVDVSGELFKANDVRTPGDIAFGGVDNGLKDVSRNSFDVLLSGVRGRHVPRVRFFTGYEDSDTYDDTTGSFVNFAEKTWTRGVQVQDVIQIGQYTVTTGLDYTTAKAVSKRLSDPTTPIAPYNADSRNTALGVFVQGQWRALDDRLTGTIGGRIDRLTLDLLETPLLPSAIAGKQHSTTFNPSVGLQYRTTDNLRIHTSLGRAFVMPDSRTLAGQSLTTSDTVAVTAGNPDLKPEHSVTFDIGAGYSNPRSGFSTDITYFHTRISNRISSVLATFPEGSRPKLSDGRDVGSAQTFVNANNAVMQGFEAELAYDFGVLANNRYVLRAFSTMTRMFSAYEYTSSVTANVADFAGVTDFDALDVRDAIIFGSKSKSRVRNVAPITVTTGLEYNSLGRWSGRLTGRYVGSRLDRDFSATPNGDIYYAPFAVIDVVFGMQVTPNYRIDALINNLTDENYYEKRGYNLPGRALQLRFSVAR